MIGTDFIPSDITTLIISYFELPGLLTYNYEMIPDLVSPL